MPLSISDVTVRFAGLTALDSVGLVAERGSINAIVGPNGSGKSTLFNVISGLVLPINGSVALDGVDLSGKTFDERVRLGITRTFQTPRIDPSMTVRQSVTCGLGYSLCSGLLSSMFRRSQFKKESREAEANVTKHLDEYDLLEIQDRPVGTLSVGLVRLIDVARATVTHPSYLLLDEPAAGLSEEELHLLHEEILKLVKLNIGVLLVEHNFRFVSDLAERVTVLNFGRKIASGTPELIERDPSFQEAYLGSFAPQRAAAGATGQRDMTTPRVIPGSVDQDEGVTQSAVRALTCRSLTASYGPIRACIDVSLTVDQGELVAVLGPNGAGKTSLLKALAGVVDASGQIALGDLPLQHASAPKRVRAGLFLVPELRGNIFPTLTTAENLRVALRHRPSNLRQTTKRNILSLFPRLEARLDAPANMLSGGEQQMLAIAMALCGNLHALLLDEPTQGLAPSVYDSIIESIRVIKAASVPLLLAEQNLRFAERIADRFVVLANGSIILTGDRHDLRDSSTIMNAYLGKSKSQ